MENPSTVEVTFQAQEWVGDFPADADRDPNRTTFTVPYEDAVDESGALPADDSYESDDLAQHSNAPKWVRDWVENSEGPFYVQTELVR